MANIAVDVHLERARRHRKVGNALHTADDEWAVVCYFYSAYHLVRYALRSDPIFNDPSALRAIHRDLTPDVRYLERHHGRGGGSGREWGINEAVGFLYRPIAGDYEKLHQASIAVRYQDGINRIGFERCGGYLERIWAAHDAGTLRVGAPQPEQA